MENNLSTKSKVPFIDLIRTYKIEIPILQRDYVQGRKNDLVEDIRKNFVEDLVTHISNDTDKLLPLDFIYGYADNESGKYDRELSKKNIEALLSTISNYSDEQNFLIDYKLSDKKNIHKDLFIPLDGQQRLTTLFLLHFYVSLKVHPEHLNLLKERLTYKTRRSSDKFCYELLNNAKNLDLALPISKSIKDATWFLSNWKKDPTVSGMLVMLQEIENQYLLNIDRNNSLETSYRQLFETPKIVFDFLDINEEGISDDLYLKMNSTGKSLSDYDNFKAWFVPKVETLIENNLDFQKKIHFINWKEKLDQEWYNVFWNENPLEADDNIFSFIKSVFSFNILIGNEQDEKIIKSNFEKLNSKDFISLKFFDDNQLINIFNIEVLFTLLENICVENNTDLDEIDNVWTITFSTGFNFRKVLTKGLAELSLIHMVYMYSVFMLILKRNKIDQLTFHKYLRVFRNIVYNTRIDDFSRIIDPITAIHNYFINDSDVIGSIDSDKWIDSFDGKQVQEEFFKKEILSNPLYAETIEEAENHHYLFGQVGFLINWSFDSNDIFVFEEFKFYKQRLFNLFSVNHISSDDFLIQRALLCYNENWTPSKSSNRYSFCKSSYTSARDRDENWRILFNSQDLILKGFLKKCDGITGQLIEFINTHQFKINNWARYFIDDASCISKCGERLFNKVNGGNFIRILDKTKINGLHTELRTWVLYKILQERGLIPEVEIKYHYANTNNDDCKIEILNKNQFIRYNRDINCFDFLKFNKEIEKYEEIDAEGIEVSQIISEFNYYLTS